MITDDHRPNLVDALPSRPLHHETVKELGESDRTVGTMPIKSRFNDVVTEFLLILESGTYAIAFDPETETWSVLESKGHEAMRDPDVEEELFSTLEGWREEHVLEYLVDNDLLPTFVLE